MVRKVIWSANAKSDQTEILKYWVSRNKSTAYSKKLHHLLKETIILIARNPTIGHLTQKENIRVKIVKDYLIIYEITDQVIYILSIFDGRRNPQEFIKRL